MLRAIGTILVTASLLGCADDHEWHGDTGFTDDERAMIESAAIEMSVRTGSRRPAIVWDGDQGFDLTIRKSAPPDQADKEWWEVPGNQTHRKRLFAESTTIYLHPGVKGPLFRAVAAHEFAHSMGLPHHPGYGLMSEHWNAGEWTEDDQKSCEQTGVCNGEK
jgi:hypothetical protein